MPNHVKNRIELIGTSEDIQKLFAAFNTFHDSKPREAVDNRLIYSNPTTGNFGWYNPITNEFEESGIPARVIGIPAGFEQEIDEARNHFPDFEKVIPMPKSLDVTSGSLGEMAHEILFATVPRKFFPIPLDELRRRFAAMSVTEQKQAVELAIQYEDNRKKYGHTTWYDWSIENWGSKWNCYDCEKESDTIYTFETAWSCVRQIIDKMSREFPTVKILYKYSDENTGSNCGIGEYENGEISFTRLENGSNEAYELAFELWPEDKERYKLVDGEYQYFESEEEA